MQLRGRQPLHHAAVRPLSHLSRRPPGAGQVRGLDRSRLFRQLEEAMARDPRMVRDRSSRTWSSGIARDLLAEAIVRFEARGLPVVFHWHDDVRLRGARGHDQRRRIPGDPARSRRPGPPDCRSPAASTADRTTCRRPTSRWPRRRRSKCRHPPRRRPMPAPIVDPVEQAIDALVAEPATIAYTPGGTAHLRARRRPGRARQPRRARGAALRDRRAGHSERQREGHLPVPRRQHDPSCQLYADHFHCFGCGAHGSRMDWLVEAEGMTRTEAASYILDWDGERRAAPVDDKKTANSKRALALWNGGKPIAGTLAERYLAETRKIAVDRLPADDRRQPAVLRSVPVRQGRQAPVPDRADDRARRHAVRHPPHRARRGRRQGRQDRAHGAGRRWARCGCGRRTAAWSSARASRPRSPPPPAFPTAGSR